MTTTATGPAAGPETGAPSGVPKTGYAFGVRISLPHGDAVTRVRETLKAEGFGVLTEIDVQRTLAEKLGHEMGKYLILGACNPILARQGLMAEQELGALLPCNVVIYEDRDAGGETVVMAQDPELMHEVVQNESLAPVAREAKERLQRALNALGGRPR
jgi:uncharacterized protein (DUF302 family)